jgi:hypothetical protein
MAIVAEGQCTSVTWSWCRGNVTDLRLAVTAKRSVRDAETQSSASLHPAKVAVEAGYARG